MSRILPYPLLTLSLIIMWLVLTNFSLGQLLLGTAVALVASRSMAALRVHKPRIKRWPLLAKLVSIVLYDIIRSNLAVSSILVRGRSYRARQSGFITVDLDLRDPMGLTVLAIVLTSTPGTAWLDFNTTTGKLLIHVFDLVDDAAWITLIKFRYERLLMEIFE